ncbi:hypothetical protein EG329_011999 [Mollisiaceae sp. DMI_Dod_QoI]|nr:hypothetical protein EG329_011999 [Helotiales sp. DMI_Dod_QoI]
MNVTPLSTASSKEFLNMTGVERTRRMETGIRFSTVSQITHAWTVSEKSEKSDSDNEGLDTDDQSEEDSDIPGGPAQGWSCEACQASDILGENRRGYESGIGGDENKSSTLSAATQSGTVRLFSKTSRKFTPRAVIADRNLPTAQKIPSSEATLSR